MWCCDPSELVSIGLDPARATELLAQLTGWPEDLPAVERWRRLTELLTPADPFPVHQRLFQLNYADWDSSQGPPPAWLPTEEGIAESNLGRLMRDLGLPDYAALHRWSVEHREAFWKETIGRLGIVCGQPCDAIADLSAGPTAPRWLPGARLNLAVSCFQTAPSRTAVVWQRPGRPLETYSYGELDALSNQVANGLVDLGLQPGEAVAVNLPMTLGAVAAYLGIVKAGCVVVSISDSFQPAEIAARLRLGQAVAVVTQDTLYAKVVEAEAPRAIVLAADGPDAERAAKLRDGDLSWSEFLSDETTFEPVLRDPDDASNILFSSGTTADPKAIPWSHTTPIRAAADAWLHHDTQPGDVLAWPTNLGWMMGPWLVYAALVNHATIALYEGSPLSRGFGEFVRDAGVTMLGLVPSLVKSWRRTRCMEGLDWSGLKLFSSTGECSNAEDYHYLMMLAGYRPVIEYCGGTEIGGGYLTGTVVQPASPATFSTPALGLDFVILDEDHQPADEGELFLIPPSIGLSNELLNHDHHGVYYAEVPAGPNGEVLRRHGDQMEALGGGYYRSHGRADDTMNLKGIKVSSAELERLLNLAPEVQETAAVAVDPPGGGPSLLVIYAVPTPDTTADGKLKRVLQQALSERYGTMFRIHEVCPLEALPRTASNKVMRRKLRVDYAARLGEADA